MVDPRHQRRGIGRRLLAAVVAESDALKIPTFLVASAEGYKLYSSMEFEDLESFSVDNGIWAKALVKLELEIGIRGHEELVQKYAGVNDLKVCMVRWPR